MIKKIIIKDVASYDHEGVTFENLQKVNFIYGGNGTGKTTISRYLKGPDTSPEVTSINDEETEKTSSVKFLILKTEGHIIRRKKPGELDYRIFDHCEMEWEGKHNEVMVYNQDFKKRNLRETIPGVFTLGDDAQSRMINERNLKSQIRHMERKGYDEIQIRREIEIQDMDRRGRRSYTVEPSVYAINNMLSKIGYSGFRLRTSGKNPYSYHIVRDNGERAGETLSEGEVTIITFLYFLQMAYGISNSNNPNREKVVVIDDPISSLDYDAISVVSELTDELMEKTKDRYSRIEQVIVLTHNTTFFQSLSDRQPKEGTCYWKLYKKKGVSRIMECGTERPVMGDYEKLWQKLRDVKSQMTLGCSLDVIDLPNLMRKIIETYFVDYGRYTKHKLFAGDYVKSPEEKQVVVSLMKWIDEGSHGVKDNLYSGNEEDMCERYMEAFMRLFEAMGQSAHYRMMMREGSWTSQAAEPSGQDMAAN